MKKIILILAIISIVLMGMAGAETGTGAADDGGFGDIAGAFADLGGGLLGDGPGLMGLDPGDLGMKDGSYTMVGGPQKRYEDIAELPYTLIVEGGKSQTLDLYENVTSGDEIILTNGLGIYTGLKIP